MRARRPWPDGSAVEERGPDLDIGPTPPAPDALVIESDAPEAEEPTPAKKRRKGTSPTARSLAECRKRGWIAGVVEKFVRFPPPGHLVDLFGVLDVVAIAERASAEVDAVAVPANVIVRTGILGIQACSGTDHARRRAKILAEPRAAAWVAAGGRLELWSWSKRGDRGKAKRWTLRVETYQEMRAAIGASIDLPADLVPDAVSAHLARKPRC